MYMTANERCPKIALTIFETAFGDAYLMLATFYAVRPSGSSYTVNCRLRSCLNSSIERTRARCVQRGPPDASNKVRIPRLYGPGHQLAVESRLTRIHQAGPHCLRAVWEHRPPRGHSAESFPGTKAMPTRSARIHQLSGPALTIMPAQSRITQLPSRPLTTKYRSPGVMDGTPSQAQTQGRRCPG